MAQINKPDEYFNTVLYTGNGTAIGSGGNAITGVGFQPDWLWIKNRSNTTVHHLQDVVRGSTKALYSNLTNAEGTSTENVNSFDSDGFTVGSGTGVNTNAENFVAWNWLADNTSGSSNTDGSITSTVSANTTSGFSIVSYTGTGANATVGHGLGVAPSMIIFKNRDAVQNWVTYHSSLGGTKAVFLDTTDAQTTSSSYFNNTSPTSSLFYIGASGDSNGNGHNMIAYCFAEKKGFSKFGSYIGNGSTDGTFIYTGFKPAFVIIKKYTVAGYSWATYDSTRYPENKSTIPALWSNLADAEGSYSTVDFLSNGFKIRDTSATINNGGEGYIYMAFAENPLVGTNNIPATAR